MLSQYIHAGYIPQCGAREDSAVDYVQHQLGMPCRLTDSSIECNVGDEEVGAMWVASGYYFENDILFKKGEAR